jgi:hypothetical protein
MSWIEAAVSSPRRRRRVLWLAMAVLVGGIVALMVVFFRNTGTPINDPVSDLPAVVPTVEKKAPLEPEARRVAGLFILTAVARKNLDTAWEITHPTLRQGLSRREWLTGNIPVQPYPVDELESAPLAIDESYKNSAVLEVALLPRRGSKIKPQTFFIGLKAVGQGKQRRWLVDYWAPRSAIGAHSNQQ